MRKKEYAGKYKITYLLFISFMLICMNAFAIEIDDVDLGFKLTLPEGFDNFPQGMSIPNAIYSYARYTTEGIPYITIGIVRMHGVIGKEPLLVEKIKKTLPPEATVRIYQEEWKGFELNAPEVIIPQSGVTFVERLVQVPLRREAIQIVVMGPEWATQEVSEVMKQLLASLEGETNW